MYLTSTNLAHYLLACGHVSAHDIVHAPFSVLEIDGHHRCFRVASGTDGGCFVKQLRVADEQSVACLQREAACYQVAYSATEFEAWQNLMPRMIDYDQDRHALIFERVANAENLVQCHRRLLAFPLEVARMLGTALADLHETTGKLTPGADDRFPCDLPWVFEFGRDRRDDAGPVIQQLAETVRYDPGFAEQLADLAAEWTSQTLIHGDLKWSNCLVSPGAKETPQAHLIDWELAGWGDPLWDVAGGIEGYLWEAMRSVPRRGGGPSDPLEDTEFLAVVEPPISALWQAYVCRRDGAAAMARECAARCLRYVGAKLLLALVESHHEAAELRKDVACVLAAGRALLGESSALTARRIRGSRE